MTARMERTATRGLANTNLQGLVESGVSKSSSSLIVRSLVTGVVCVASSGSKRARKVSKPREIELRICVQRDGIKVFTTRL
jgi:hypothetical protein